MDTAEYSETMAWERNPVTEKQVIYLKRAKIDLSTVRGKGHASKLLNLYFGSRQTKLASPGQRATMARMGHAHADQATAAEARQFFAARNKTKQEEMAI